MNSHIEDTEVQLSEVKERIIDVLDGDLLLDQIIGNRFASQVMLAQALKLGGGPAPVLEHLRGGFNKVSNNGCTVEARIFGATSEIVDSMSEFMEQGNDFLVFKEGGLGGCGL